MQEAVNQLIFVVACITAAEVWNNFGYIKEWRLRRNDPTWQGFDKKAMKHDILQGVILGIGTVVYQAVTVNTPVGFAIPDYTSFQVFVVSVAGMFGAVVAVDKVLVGGLLGIDSRTPAVVPAPEPAPKPSPPTPSPAADVVTPQPAPAPQPAPPAAKVAFTSNFVPSPDGKTHGIPQGQNIVIKNSNGPDYMFYGLLEEVDPITKAIKVDSVIWDGFNDGVKDGVLVIKTLTSVTVTNKDGTKVQMDVSLPKGSYKLVLRDDPTPNGQILGEEDYFVIF